MRICLLGDASSIHLRRWTELTIRRGHEVLVLSIAPQESTWDAARVVHIEGWDTGSLRVPVLRQLVQFIRIRRNVRAALRSYKPDIVHAHFASTYGWQAATGGERPFVITTWGSDIYGLRAAPIAARALTLLALRQAAAVTGDSRDLIRATARLGVRHERLHYVHVGVDTALFTAERADRARAALNLRLDAQIIVSPRALQPHYNVGPLLHALASLIGEYPRLLLLQKCYLAEPEYEYAMRQLVGQLGLDRHVQFVPPSEYHEVPTLLNAADVVVSLASTDSSPVSVLEALACGRTVVASDVCSIREWIRDGRNGFLVEPTDPNAIADTLRRALGLDDDTRRSWSGANRRLIVQSADQERHLDALEQLYRSLVDGETR